MDSKSLMLSSVRSLIMVSVIFLSSFLTAVFFLLTLVFVPQVVEKCHVGMGSLEAAEAKANDWAAEKEKLEAKKEQLQAER